MKQNLLFWVVLSGILSLVVLEQNVSAEASNTTLSSADRQEIMDLIHSFSYTFDSKDLDKWLTLFTGDAIFSIYDGNSSTPSVVTSSNEQRRMLFEPSLEGNQTRHFMTNTILNQTGVGSAEGITMELVVVQLQSPSKQDRPISPNLIITGYYEDKFVKTQNGWKFSSRELHSDPPLIIPPNVSVGAPQRNS